MKNKLGLFILYLISSFASADWFDVNMPVGVTDISQEVYTLHMAIFYVVVAIGILVFGFLFWSMWRFQKSKNKKPSKFKENHKLEIIWTIVPTLILVAMAVPASITLKNIYDHEAEEGGIDIQVIGKQWYWQYKYLDEQVGSKPLSFASNLTTPEDQWRYNRVDKTENYLMEVDNPVVVPVDTPIRFLITSNDVIHSWYMPDFAVKQDAIPGFINVAKTTINEPGIYRGNCTELCGDRHAFMPIVVKAVAQEEYEEWLEEKRVEAEEVAYLTEKDWTAEELLSMGEEIYTNNCAQCHGADGLGNPGYFPALAGSDIVMNDKTRQTEILMEGISGSMMQSFSEKLNEVELASVITFTKLSWDNDKNGDGEIVLPKDIVEYKEKNK